MNERVVIEIAKKTVEGIKEKTAGVLKEVQGGTMTICSRVGNICRSGLTRLERRKQRAIRKFGVEIWKLYQEKIFKSIYEQDRVKELVAELSGYEKEIKEIKEKITEQKKQRERRSAIRKAGADLNNKDPNVRKAAIRVLDKLLGKEALSYLNKALKDPDPGVSRRAAETMHRLVDSSVEEIPEPAEKEINEQCCNPEDELKKYRTGGNWYEISGQKVLGKNRAFEMLLQLKNRENEKSEEVS